MSSLGESSRLAVRYLPTSSVLRSTPPAFSLGRHRVERLNFDRTSDHKHSSRCRQRGASALPSRSKVTIIALTRKLLSLLIRAFPLI